MRLNLFFFLLALASANEAADKHSEVPRKTKAMKKEELFRDFFPLTRENFTEAVIRSRMAWVVFPHNGMLDHSWKVSAAKLRGILRFGMFHRKEETQLLKELKLAEGTVARVYPYGGKIVKRKYAEDCRSAADAVTKAEQSIPDKISDFEHGGRLEGLLMDSFTHTPPRLPVLLLTRESPPPSVFRALALRFERYATFRVLQNPSSEKVRRLGLPAEMNFQAPGIVVLLLENAMEPKPKFFAVQFDSKAAQGGELNYANVLSFLLQVNRRFRHTLPGDNGAEDPAVIRAEDVLKEERDIFEINEGHLNLDSPTSAHTTVAPIATPRPSTTPAPVKDEL